jgi:hypothetical protein
LIPLSPLWAEQNKEEANMRQRVIATVCTVVVAGMCAGAALAGEVKGPPYQGPPVPGGIADETNSTPAGVKAHSLCAFSGLNDFDSDLGQTTKPTQTPADNAPGAPGQGFEIAPGVVISCRGNG